MDTLSQILQPIRARSPLIADLQLATDVSIGIPALGGLPFHYVINGSCHLDTGSEHLELQTGDFVMLARLPNYRFKTGTGSHGVEIMDFAERDKFSVEHLGTGIDHLLKRSFGEGPVKARILSAIIMLGGGENASLTSDLPRIMLLRDVKLAFEPWLTAAIDFMSTDARKTEPGFGAIAERLVELIFIAALRKWLLAREHEPAWIRGLTDPTISRVMNAMHADPGRRWTLRELAVLSGRSRSGLAKHFKQVMDETPFAYLTRWRMHKAAVAIAGGDSTAKTSIRLGYQGAQAFARTFTAAFGKTPAQYRKHHRSDGAKTL